MIVRRTQVRDEQGDEGRAAELGPFECLRYSDAGGIAQFGAYVETLAPGSRSSVRHWHEQCDEMLYVLTGEATVIEDDGPHALHPGDAACWPAGTPNAHHVVNRSSAPCSYVIVGTRVREDVCHYPDEGKILYTERDRWRLVDREGATIKAGHISASRAPDR
jgi:uncharacterized cupin superfamily protein